MKNYTIYVANQTSGGGGTQPNPIKPKPNPTTPDDNTPNNTDVISALKGIKAGIIGTIVYKVVKTGVSVVEKCHELAETITGEYRYVGWWKSASKVWDNITNPVGFVFNTIQSNIERDHEKMTYEENVKIRGGYMGDYNL